VPHAADHGREGDESSANAKGQQRFELEHRQICTNYGHSSRSLWL
jgi:RNA:NAD 2'-phosphotransferase (TPT1/KptA family)